MVGTEKKDEKELAKERRRMVRDVNRYKCGCSVIA